MKFQIKQLIATLPLLALCGACSEKEEIVFDSELPRFETRDNAILLEVIPPYGTAADDVISIAGDFNGGADAAIADARWQLEKSSEADKWGIYLFPADFVGGKTLADGFYFISQKQGEERTLTNTTALHTLNVTVGSRTNVRVDRWAAYFEQHEDDDDDEVEPTHDGYTIYVIDETGWDALTLYMWGDVNNLNGDWPGMQPTGKQTINGVTFTYFDMGEANTGLGENLIFNNNGGGSQLIDYAYTIDHDIYLHITSSGVTVYDPDAIDDDNNNNDEDNEDTNTDDDPIDNPETSTYTIYVIDETGWSALALYMWGDVNGLGGGWPGVQPTGTTTIDGQTYTYFQLNDVAVGLGENLIFNNNGGGLQLDNFYVTLSRDYYLRVTADGVEEIEQ